VIDRTPLAAAAAQTTADEQQCAEQADRCRRLARATYDRSTAELLEGMARDYDRQAARSS
jgi:hypothetical protein